MLVTNQTTSDIYFGPLHLGAGVGTQLTVDDTTATSLYLTNDSVADALNNAYQSGKITVSGAADPFPRPTGTPQLLHGDGDPEGLVYAPQGSLYMRRDGTGTNSLYVKTTGVTYNTGWEAFGSLAPNVAFAAPADPTGCGTSELMMGVPGSITPVRSGNILAIYRGNGTNTTTNDSWRANLRYGTGTPPANGAAPVGTVLCGPTLGDPWSSQGQASFCLAALAMGLSPYTSYWFDLSLWATPAGTASVHNLTVSLIEV